MLARLYRTMCFVSLKLKPGLVESNSPNWFVRNRGGIQCVRMYLMFPFKYGRGSVMLWVSFTSSCNGILVVVYSSRNCFVHN